MICRNLALFKFPPILFLIAIFSLTPLVGLAEDNRLNPHDRDFSGHWELDYQRSDHPQEKIRTMYIQARSEAERIAERSRNAGRYVDPRMFNFQSIIGLGQLAQEITKATVLDITQEGDHIVIRRNEDYALVCDFSDMGFKTNAVGTEGCAWQEDQLTFQVALPEGLKVFHRLSIASDRSRLNIATTVMVDGLRYPFTLNRVFMPYEPGEGLYNCEYTIAKGTTCTLKGSIE